MAKPPPVDVFVIEIRSRPDDPRMLTPSQEADSDERPAPEIHSARLALVGRQLERDRSSGGNVSARVWLLDDHHRAVGVLGRPVVDVMAELKAAEEAADAAAREARKALREKRKAELSADLDARVESLKEKLHVA
jgi:hypothetical protein